MNRIVRVYSLHDPNTKEIRYVGKTVQPLSIRLSGHLTDARKAKGRHSRYVLKWIRSLSSPPLIQLLCECADDGSEREIAYIALFKAQGCRLTNLTDGGEGTLGHVPTFSPQHRARISAAKKGHVVSPETREKIRQSLSGRKLSPERCAQISARLLGNTLSVGRKPSAETRAKMSAAHKGNKYSLGCKLSPERKAALSTFHKGNKYSLGRKLSPEHKARISAANKGRQFSEETRSRMSAAAKIREALKRESANKNSLVSKGNTVIE